jgi:hypothetical protein
VTNTATSAEISGLFANGDPEEVWLKASGIVRRISPAFEFSATRAIFDDVVRMFHGEYPGYAPIRTLYHDLRHTLDVFLCAVRLAHGMHASGFRFTDEEMTMIMIAALMHDLGYAQPLGEETGTGAQHTRGHIRRSIKFLLRYAATHGIPRNQAAQMKFMLCCTDTGVSISDVKFPDERTRLLSQIIGTADLAGQMADRTYLEKLLFLYLEFKEAQFGGYQNIYDLLCKTRDFYEFTRTRLDTGLGGIYRNLAFHFKECYGIEANYYLESIDKNIAYLSKVTEANKTMQLSMLKRGGIVKKSRSLVAPEDIG